MSSDCNATCWTPGPPKNSRYSSIWLLRALVELDPVVHLSELDVADDVVDRPQPDAGRGPPVRPGDLLETGQKRPRVLLAVDERVDVLAVGSDRRALNTAEVILDPVRLDDSACASLHGLPVGLAGVRHRQRRVLHTVAVHAGEARDLTVALHSARQDETDVSLLDNV